jgi:hypothetical protein
VGSKAHMCHQPQLCYELQAGDLSAYPCEEILALLAFLLADQEGCVIELFGLPGGPITVWSPNHQYEDLAEYIAREWPRQQQGGA